MSEERPASILIADDHPLVLRALSELIGSERDMAIVATCSDGASARNRIRELRPDVAVLDLAMPIHSGLDVLRWLRTETILTRVVLLTADIRDRDVALALSLNANAVLTKTAAPETLVACIRSVIAGDRWIPEEIQDAANREERRRDAALTVTRMLTDREREIVGMAVEALSNKEIARKLDIAEGTVKIHLNNAYGKLNVANRAALLRAIGPIADLLDGRER